MIPAERLLGGLPLIAVPAGLASATLGLAAGGRPGSCQRGRERRPGRGQAAAGGGARPTRRPGTPATRGC